ncbi:MAG: PaaI family thioesterase [Gammaproteobacteria bacterium]
MNAQEIAALLHRELPPVDHRGEMIEEIGKSRLRMRLPALPEYVSRDLPPGSGQSMLSAPIMMGFADTAMFAAIHAFYGARAIGAIVNFNVSFMRIAGAKDLVAEVRLLKKGRKLAFFDVLLHGTDETEPCAHVTATYSVWQPPA